MSIKKCTWVRKICVTALAVAMAVTLLPVQADTVKAEGEENQEQEQEQKHEHSYERGKVSYVWADDYSTCTASVTCSDEGCDAKMEETKEVDGYSDNQGPEQMFFLYAKFDNPLFEEQDRRIDSLKGTTESSAFCAFALGRLYYFDLSDAERKAVVEGSETITFSLKSEEKAPEENVKTAIDNLAKENGLTVAKYLDVTLSKKVDSGEASNVTTIKDETMRINMRIPEDLLAANSGVTREYTVLRYHGDEATALRTEAWDGNDGGKYISFWTDGFSAYALAYKDVANSPAPAPDNSTSNTSNDSGSASVSGTASTTSAESTVATLPSGQVITTETLATYASTTILTTDVQGATISAVTTAQTATIASQAVAMVGANAVIATVVDISVPAGTDTATFTLNVSGLVAGQTVSVLHLRSDGVVESLPVSNVSDGSVTFTMSSYSPVAVVTNATAPKTGETFPMGTVLAIVAALGCAVYAGKKFATR